MPREEIGAPTLGFRGVGKGLIALRIACARSLRILWRSPRARVLFPRRHELAGPDYMPQPVSDAAERPVPARVCVLSLVHLRVFSIAQFGPLPLS